MKPGATMIAVVFALAYLSGGAVASRESRSTDAGARTASKGQAVTVLTVAAQPSSGSIPIYVALAHGYFAKRHLDIKFLTVANPPLALLGGDVQLAVLATATSAVTASQGKPLPAVVGLFRAPYSLILRKGLDSPSRTMPYPLNIRALPNGFVLGIPFRGGSGWAFTSAAVHDAGLQEGKDYSVVQLGAQGNSVAALCAGQIDVGFFAQPFTYLVINQGCGLPLVDQAKGQGPNFSDMSFLGATQDWISKNAAVAKKVVAAITEADAFLRQKKNQASVVETTLKYIPGIDQRASAQTIAASAKAFTPFVTCASVATELRFLLAIGQIGNLPGCDQILSRFVPRKNPFGG